MVIDDVMLDGASPTMDRPQPERKSDGQALVTSDPMVHCARRAVPRYLTVVKKSKSRLVSVVQAPPPARYSSPPVA